MLIKRPYWLLLGVLVCLSGRSPTRLPAPDSQRPPGQIPTHRTPRPSRRLNLTCHHASCVTTGPSIHGHG
jgi:hypothetical protein